MIILPDTTGLTIKSTIQDENHVRLDNNNVRFWVCGSCQEVEGLDKPWTEQSINDCHDYLTRLRAWESRTV